jgi:succinoglycan biosynthesis transport protein ExoP
MLLKTTRSLANQAPSAGQYDSVEELFRKLVGFLHRRYHVIALVFLLAMALGGVYLYTTPPKFSAQAKLVIDTRKAQLFQQQPIFSETPTDTVAVDSQVELLQSENVLLQVVKNLHLTEDPEFIGPRRGLEGLVDAIVGFASSLFASAVGPPSEASADGPPSEASAGGLPSEFDRTRSALGRLQAQLTVKRVGLTYVINIEFRSLRPDRAEQVANAVADAYMADQLEAKYESARRAGNWMQDRARELREQAVSAESAVLNFKTNNNIVETGGRLINEQQLAELNSALIQGRAQTVETKAKLDRVDEILRSGLDVPDATVSDSLRNEVVVKLRSKYLDLKRLEAEYSLKYGENHLAVRKFRDEMREIRKVIFDELGRIAQTYRSDYEIAKTRADSIARDLEEIVSASRTTNQAQIKLRELDGAAQAYRGLYDNFLQRYMESVQQQSFPVSEARVITRATRPGRASHPKSLLILIVSAAGGMFLGFGIGVLRDLSDRVFRSGDQVESILQADCISVLPKMKQLANRPSHRSGANYGGENPRIIERDKSLFWTVVDTPLGRFAESIRAIKVAMDLHKSDSCCNVVAITSALPHEGKSMVAMALAQTMLGRGRRVLLLDGDLRNPALSRTLTPGVEFGLLDVITNRVSISDALCIEPSTRLAFLPAVVRDEVAYSSQILSCDTMKQLFDQLREAFDYIVVDLSPLAPVVDVRAMTHLVDSFVFVIEWGSTKIELVERVLGTARSVYDNLLGVVLNKADLNVLSRHESHGGNYYFNRYHARYGHTEESA